MGDQKQAAAAAAAAAELCLLHWPLLAGSLVDLAGIHFLSDPGQPARQPLAGSTLRVRILEQSKVPVP